MNEHVLVDGDMNIEILKRTPSFAENSFASQQATSHCHLGNEESSILEHLASCSSS